MIPTSEGGDVARLSLTLPGRVEACEIAIGRGLLSGLPSLLAEYAAAPRYAVISDSTVAPLHGERVATTAATTGSAVDLLTFPAGEASKTTGTWAELVGELARRGMGRDGCVVAVGGGVTGDLAGFVAASFARGIRFVQVPTSLLAMIDASIGGKTGVDLPAGKNLAGAFHQPSLVVIDPEVLQTLPASELRTGLAEAVKHGAVGDREYFHWLVDRAAAISALDPPSLDRLVRGSVRLKAAVVARDALEAGERAVLNFGHTIGHAVELLTSFRIPHGEAVAMGMVAEARIGERAGVTREGTADEVRAAVRAMGLPDVLPGSLSPDAILEAARTDKKARGGAVRYSLLRSIGTPARADDGGWTVGVEPGVARAALER